MSQLEDIGDFDVFVAEQVEIAIENKITQFLNDTSPRHPRIIQTPSVWQPSTLQEAHRVQPHQIKTAHSGDFSVYSPEEPELSHEDAVYDEEDTSSKQIVAPVHVGGLTVESILSDSDVEDPNTEAVGEAGEGMGFEHLVPQQAAYVPPPIQPLPKTKTPRPYAKKPPKMNAKVHEMTDIGEAQRSSF